MKALKNKLTLSKGEGNHRELYKSEVFKEGLVIPKRFENNNRNRNACHGYVEGIDPENKLNVSLGDRVYCHHFILMGDMSKTADDRMLTPDGREIYGARHEDVFFKIPTDNWEDAECLNDYILATPIMEGGSSIMEAKPSETKCVIMKYPPSLEGKVSVGQVVMCVPFAMGYTVELGNEVLCRIRYKEIAAFIDGDTFIPTNGYCIVKRDKSGQGLILLSTPEPKWTGTVLVADEELPVKSGDRVYFSRSKYTTITHAGEEYLLMKEGHIYFKML